MLVSLHMFAAVDRRFECFMAVWAHEGPQVTMCTHVTFQASICREHVTTLMTLV
jgi:hypothetical protein